MQSIDSLVEFVEGIAQQVSVGHVLVLSALSLAVLLVWPWP